MPKVSGRKLIHGIPILLSDLIPNFIPSPPSLIVYGFLGHTPFFGETGRVRCRGEDCYGLSEREFALILQPEYISSIFVFAYALTPKFAHVTNMQVMIFIYF